MSERVMARIVKIDEVIKHPWADALDVCTIGGWEVVTRLGEFKAGELAIYFEIDSWISKYLAPFLSKGRSYNGVVGERLRTKKIRGVVSQGLLLPVMTINNMTWNEKFNDFENTSKSAICNVNSSVVDTAPVQEDFMDVIEGMDVTEFLGIQKWEKELSANLRGVARGDFPSFIPKTDQERVQNMRRYFEEAKYAGYVFEKTEKLDGSSMTVYMNDGVFGVCSRNLDLEETEGNSFWSTARKFDIEERIRQLGLNNFAIQGELVGPGVQGNKYGLKELDFYVFDIWDIEKKCYLNSFARADLANSLYLKYAPIVDNSFVIPSEMTMEEFILHADGPSVIGNKSAREGFVYKNISDPSKSFKSISNKWLMKNENDDDV